MSIISTVKYKPLKKDLEREEDISFLLKDVKNSLIEITLEQSAKYNNINLQDKSSKDILNIIESKKFTIKTNKSFDLEVDLLDANKIIRDYRYNSERGCQSCTYKRSYKPVQDETRIYCDLMEHETEGNITIFSGGFSPKVKEYFEKGCGDRNPIFRPIEEVLKEEDRIIYL